MICKTSQRSSIHASIRPCSVNIFKTLSLRDCWADVDETWHVYSIVGKTNFWEVEFWVSAPALHAATTNIACSGEMIMTHPDRDGYCYMSLQKRVLQCLWDLSYWQDVVFTHLVNHIFVPLLTYTESYLLLLVIFFKFSNIIQWYKRYRVDLLSGGFCFFLVCKKICDSAFVLQFFVYN